MHNPYLPYEMKVEKIVVESPEKDLKTFDLSFVNPEDIEKFKYTSGQFAEVGIVGSGEAPFGIASAPEEKNLIRFSIKNVGSFTSAIHAVAEGDIITLRGPLGNSWPLENLKGKDIVIVGGGFAFTTLRSLIRHILEPENRADFGKVDVVYGNRSPGQMLYKEELNEWAKRDDINMHLTIDRPADDWDHLVGFVPAITEQVIKASDNSVAIVCGPPLMIKFTLPVLKNLGFTSERIYTSLEMKMKCGIGMCGRCNIGKVYVCKDGPVFTMAELEKLPSEY
ncbi:NAD(P)H-flavin reductase [Desulfonispora thiosulfatigenes DSM 11270]|uniref:NAD(P)H-flavin reductase n=1 Tax=Desulfonispora thiosulfatigenes DSM 11270 TaxID=656914 RepID=A0A1W1VD47_DESTI|nr:FAD/NAD(P)-binding protein [Desulfonispora thiosulfatigenes]SMB91298.1 NAD(P)H-flavin reductase [Desulfonispora thiosulfatigenes DSM 11270]